MPDSHPSPLQLFIDQLELHSPLSSAAKLEIRGLPFSIKAYGAGTHLLREGDRPTECQILLTGFAYRQKETRGGLRQIVSLHNPGEALDLQQLLLDVADHSLRMLTGGEVATVGHRVLLDLIARRPEVGSAIFKATLIEGSIFREWVLNVGRRDARTRIAHFLCEFYVRLRKSPWVEAEGFDLPMTQEQLADVTGLTPVHINRTLKGLEKEGLIRCSRRSIALVSWRGLQEAGQFDGRYLHLGQAA